jgi:hypothetical protein
MHVITHERNKLYGSAQEDRIWRLEKQSRQLSKVTKEAGKAGDFAK